MGVSRAGGLYGRGVAVKESIGEGWATYAANVLDKDSPQLQRIETRRAFYAGCAHMFGTIMGGLEPGTEATENDLQHLTDLSEELKQYAVDLVQGKA